mmetsp:Transcript_18900/g.46877  ORF Transcript_18900/g.46877 Transcript_18900/m.46877 type:complete len:237 (+) Transcript_18900:88-798(+)
MRAGSSTVGAVHPRRRRLCAPRSGRVRRHHRVRVRGARAERAHPGQRRRPNRVQGRCFRRPGADPGGVQGGGVQPGKQSAHVHGGGGVQGAQARARGGNAGHDAQRVRGSGDGVAQDHWRVRAHPVDPDSNVIHPPHIPQPHVVAAHLAVRPVASHGAGNHPCCVPHHVPHARHRRDWDSDRRTIRHPPGEALGGGVREGRARAGQTTQPGGVCRPTRRRSVKLTSGRNRNYTHLW